MASPVRLTVQDEIAAMRRRWPGFRATAMCDLLVTWRGTLAPLRQAYEVRILYGPKFLLGRLHLRNYQPRVEVISPHLVARHTVTGSRVPHVYANDDNPDSPLLCLYDPATDEWQPGRRPVADTIVPWTTHWLACYEGWLATGKWTGGGRHPTSRVSDTESPHRCSGDANSNYNRLQRLAETVADIAGTHGSRAILAHAMAGPCNNLDTPERQFIYQDLVQAGLIGPCVPTTSDPEPISLARDAA